jgi:hypothetical protein
MTKRDSYLSMNVDGHPSRDGIKKRWMDRHEEIDCSAVSALRCVIAEVKQRWSFIGWVTKIYYLELLRALEGTLSCWSQLYLQALASTNPHWARVLGYVSFSCAPPVGTLIG